MAFDLDEKYIEACEKELGATFAYLHPYNR